MVKNEIDNVRFNFLYIDTYSFGPTWVYPESVVPYNMLRYIISGEGVFCIDDEEVKVKKNENKMAKGPPTLRPISRSIPFSI